MQAVRKPTNGGIKTGEARKCALHSRPKRLFSHAESSDTGWARSFETDGGRKTVAECRLPSPYFVSRGTGKRAFRPCVGSILTVGVSNALSAFLGLGLSLCVTNASHGDMALGQVCSCLSDVSAELMCVCALLKLHKTPQQKEIRKGPSQVSSQTLFRS
ncbi:hypothetical protein BJY04DRAFT_109668 [Aspergillus karnatakaensis]|uniref:uncharacterized protein n=1 Tax=Aspergillus karnatakaensis TaxID=1810916 RepID=UPI003CCCF5C4